MARGVGSGGILSAYGNDSCVLLHVWRVISWPSVAIRRALRVGVERDGGRAKTRTRGRTKGGELMGSGEPWLARPQWPPIASNGPPCRASVGCAISTAPGGTRHVFE
ncbi:MAG: hypothetical protein OHK0015_21670 [Chloroflexi bacterium OHK40]